MGNDPARHEVRRGWAAVLVVVAVGLAATSAPAGATGDDPRSVPSGRIVGGRVADPAAWPSVAAVLDRRYADPAQALICGATVIDASWVLTAAHCVLFDDGTRIPASALDVLAGTAVLGSGGTRVPVAEVRVVPGFDLAQFRNDIAVLRLERPVLAPPQALVAQGQVVPAHIEAEAAGWGSTNPATHPTAPGGAPVLPVQLRDAVAGTGSDAECTDYFGSAIFDFHAPSNLCAFDDGVSTCFGDSGGPLRAEVAGEVVQVGVTSWIIDCTGDYAMGFAKVSAFSNWIAAQARYGPHPNASAFVSRTYYDLYRRAPSAAETASAVSRLNRGTTPAALVTGLVQGPTYQRSTAGVARLYQAFFLRTPDTAGLGYWWTEVNRGRSLPRISNIMAASPEFRTRYGGLDDGGFVELVYANVLDRPVDVPGQTFWLSELASGRRSRGEVMVGFSEAAEFKALHRTRIDVITTFFGLLRRVPTGGELTEWAPRANLALAGSLLESVGYANRF